MRRQWLQSALRPSWVIGDYLPSLSFQRCATQFYFYYSIYRLTGNKIIFGIIMAISIPAFIVGMVVGAEAIVISLYVFPSFLILVVKLKPCTLLVRLADLPRINNIVIAWLSGQVAADIMITGKSVCCFSFCLASSLTLLIYCYFFS